LTEESLNSPAGGQGQAAVDTNCRQVNKSAARELQLAKQCISGLQELFEELWKVC
jgi:hypothetical protein